MTNKFFLSKLKDNTLLAWSSTKGIMSKKFIYMEHFKVFDNFKSNYEYFKITNKIYKLTDGMQVVKLNF